VLRATVAILALVATSAEALEDGSAPVDGGTFVASSFHDESVSASGQVLSPFGLFPIIENTGAVLRSGEAYVGSLFLGVGLGGRFQIGTNPEVLWFKTPNLSAKFLLVERPRFLLAAHLETMLLTKESAFFDVSNFYSRIDPSGLWLTPVGVTGTWAPIKDLYLSVTTVAQVVTLHNLASPQAVMAANAQLEWSVFKHHALVLHAGDMGLAHKNDLDYWQVGPSYRYHRWIIDASIGVVYRKYVEAVRPQPVPNASLGIAL
jgi:hypothetical protein